MEFNLRINCDNAAFADEALHEEVARILRDVADEFASGREHGPLFDINGNKVGAYDIIAA